MAAALKTKRKVNLVFQGGGVKGIAYAGFLRGIPPEVQVVGLGGASAGAIVAALLAVGKQPEEIIRLVSELDLKDLLATEDLERVERLRRVWRERKVWRMIWDRRLILDDLGELLKKRGLFGLQRIEAWLRDPEVLGSATFGSLGDRPLRIIAADLTRRDYRPFSKQHDGENGSIATAVLCSIAIPLFFEPRDHGGSVLVDGGLLSNFPSHLFRDHQYPTLGVRLETTARNAESLDAPFPFFRALLETMLEAHDKQRSTVGTMFKFATIRVPDVSATQFELAGSERTCLINAGEAAAAKVDWESIGSAVHQQIFIDPEANLALSRVVENGHRIWAAERTVLVDELDEESELILTIGPRESGFSTVYHQRSTFTVKGSGRIAFGPWTVEAEKRRPFEKASLASVDTICTEIRSNGTLNQLPWIPAENGEDRKRFLYYFDPPIDRTSGPRTFESIIRIPDEFKQSIGSGEDEYVGWGKTLRAAKHNLKHTFEIRVHGSLRVSVSRGQLKPTEVIQPGSQLQPASKVIDGQVFLVYTSGPSQFSGQSIVDGELFTIRPT